MVRWALVVGLFLAGCDDGSSPSGGVELDAGAMDAMVDAAPDLGVDAAPMPDAGAAFVQPRFERAGDDFYDTPWPSDARLTPEGAPDLSGFPAVGPTFARLIADVHANLRGFATMPVVFVPFEHDLSGLGLPTPAESVAAESPIQLLALGANCGRRIPVEVAVRAEADRYVRANTLQVKNTVGTVLTPGEPHALVVRTGFGAEAGRPARPAPDFVAAWAGDGSRASAALEPLRTCLPQTGLSADELAVATVFTPQDPVAELQAMWARAMDPAVETRAPVAFGRDGVWSRRRLRITTYSGLVEMPVFQRGDSPYTQVGGGLVRDAEGRPEIQRWEPVPFAVARREFTDEAPFEGPRPALVFIDGTGWRPWSHLRGRWMNAALDAGFVVFSFMPQFHGARAGFEGEPEAITFNFVNPEAGRTNFRQQAVEIAFFSRVIREQLIGLPDLPPIDGTRIAYGGHSQGALAGALAAAVDRGSYAAWVLNGVSSYLSLTVLERKDILDFERVVRGLLANPGPLDAFSPALAMMQMASEVVDPHNFARQWRGSAANPAGNHVFVINGFNDDTTTPRGMDHLTLSAQLPTVGPPGWNIDPFGVGVPPQVSLPLAGNAEALDGSPLTLATWLDPVRGHFTVHRDATLQQMTLGFWRSALAGAVPVLAPNAELACADGADDDEDGAVDCADADCAARAPCIETRCADEADDDGNGLVDCADPACADASVCHERICDDEADNDGDGLVDCADPSCARREPCAETACRDTRDGDGDGLVDCDDPDCQPTAACHETDCDDGVDNDRDGLTDCADDECASTLACPEPDCADGLDDDENGWADCADPRCYGAEVCPSPLEAACDDGADDDGDGLVDCADPDCAAACASDHCGDGDLGTAVGIAVFQGDLADYSDDWDPGDCTPLGSGKDAPEVALRWEAPADGRYLVSTLGSAADTVLTVFPADCDRGRELACQDDQPGVTTSALTIEAQAGDAVVFVVAGYGADDDAPVVLHVLPR